MGSYPVRGNPLWSVLVFIFIYLFVLIWPREKQIKIKPSTNLTQGSLSGRRATETNHTSSKESSVFRAACTAASQSNLGFSVSFNLFQSSPTGPA